MQVRVVLKQTAVINYSIETAKWVISRTRIHARSESHRVVTDFSIPLAGTALASRR